MVHENRFAQANAAEAEAAAEFLRVHPPAGEVWQDGEWLRLLREGALSDLPDVQEAYRRILLLAAISVRASGGSVSDAEIAEGIAFIESL